jgi:predicted DCC family thiol-disulfide oxidoreductase YuxK
MEAAGTIRNTELKAELPRATRGYVGDVVIFDGNCRFCWRQVRRLHQFDWGKRLHFLSLHDPEVRERFPDLTHEQLMNEMYVVTSDGMRHAGVHALRYLTRRLPLLWPVAPLFHIPGMTYLCHKAYRWVAQRRYRLAGKTDCGDACEIHLR